MFRWVTYITSIICILLLVATGMLWLRSYWVCDMLIVGWEHEAEYSEQPVWRDSAHIWTTPGEIVATGSLGLRVVGGSGWSLSHLRYPDDFMSQFPASLFPRRIGWDRLGMIGGNTRSATHLPFWTLALLYLIGAFPGAWVLNHRRRRGLCGNCGYDLRATPERCPECGTAVRNRRPVGAAVVTTEQRSGTRT